MNRMTVQFALILCFYLRESIYNAKHITQTNRFVHRRRRRGTGGHVPPPKIREKYFSGNYYVQFGHFSGKNRVKLGNFVNFSKNVIKIWAFF